MKVFLGVQGGTVKQIANYEPKSSKDFNQFSPQKMATNFVDLSKGLALIWHLNDLINKNFG